MFRHKKKTETCFQEGQ